MASIVWLGWATSNGGSGSAVHGGTAHAQSITLSSASCLSFGGGTRYQFQQNITINSWNTSMHWAKDTAQSSVDYCAGSGGNRSHLTPCYPLAANFKSPDRDTACYVSTGPGGSALYRKMIAGSPLYKTGLCLHFTHGVPVYCNPAYIWVGTNAAVDGYPYNAQFAMADLTSSQPTWGTVHPNGKLSLRVHGATAQVTHQWYFLTAVRPDAVGFNNKNFIKTQITYY